MNIIAGTRYDKVVVNKITKDLNTLSYAIADCTCDCGRKFATRVYLLEAKVKNGNDIMCSICLKNRDKVYIKPMAKIVSPERIRRGLAVHRVSFGL